MNLCTSSVCNIMQGMYAPCGIKYSRTFEGMVLTNYGVMLSSQVKIV